MRDLWELHWRDYYFLLGLRSNAEPEAVEGAAKQLLAKYHPDRSGTGDAERFKLINEAREVLTDSVKRRRYDAEYKRRASKQKQPHRPSTSSEANKPDDKSTAPGFWKGVLIGGGTLLVLVAWWLSGGRNIDVLSTLRERPAERVATGNPLSNYPSGEARHQKHPPPAVQSAEDRRRAEAAARRAGKRHKAEQRLLEHRWTLMRQTEQHQEDIGKSASSPPL